MTAASMPRRLAALLVLAPFGAPAAEPAGQSADETIEEIVVTADFRGRALDEVPQSVTLLDAGTIDGLASQHFEELINVVPNLNWSGDGHRARYLQIRGVGELEQYEGALNPSVGFLVDDIDFSGIGTIATLFDVERIEVLRGPQGSRYGANALAGLVYVRSASPTPEWNGRVELRAGEDDAKAAGIAVGGPLAAAGDLRFRASAHRHESDGFRDNAYLGRDDTNRRRESTVRGRLGWQPADTLSVDLAALFVDIDNGYDAFAIDNSYTMLSDKPGRDAQQSAGASLRVEWSAGPMADFTSITAYADSAMDFSFDADWGNDRSWAPVTYDYVSISDRSRRTLSQEFRIGSTDEGRLFGGSTGWLAGVYAMELDDGLVTVNRGQYLDPSSGFEDSLDDRLASDYEARSVALFGTLDHELGDATRLGAGLRIERRSVSYADSNGLGAAPAETMSGGELTLSHDVSDALMAFASVSKGYKAGGFNLGQVPGGEREFGAETLWNLEAGVKSRWLGDTLFVNASLFRSRRENQQVRTSTQLVPGDPASFVFFTDNAAQGDTLGLEAEARWLPGSAWELYLNVGLLDAEFDEYDAGESDLDGRDQAHAPNYTLAAGVGRRHENGWFWRLDATARDAFYFDVSHDQRSQAYELVNARVGYETDRWSAELWGKNLLDTDYAVRGFYFGNEPPDFPERLYVRLGDPRQIGVTLEARF